MCSPSLVKDPPVAGMFLDFGMHRGQLLAYLMADQRYRTCETC